MIGQKGVPALHGGVERHVEELGARLVGLGDDVTVFTRPNYTDPELDEYRGMRLVSLPTTGTKHFDAIVHSVLASFAVWRGGFDIVHYQAIGPCLASPIAKLRGRRVVATVHAQDWRQAKWGLAASALLRLGEWMALHVPDTTICVSESLTGRYAAQGAQHVVCIPNGVTIDPGDDVGVLAELGLASGHYLLFAGRLIPDKGLHHLIAAHASSGTDLPLVVAGGSSGTDDYVKLVRSQAGEGVVFAGYRYGAALAALFRNCALFVLPSDLEGMPIVLLEALAYGAPVLASDIAPNQEILGQNGRFFAAGDVDSLRTALIDGLADTAELKRKAVAAMSRVAEQYSWDSVAEATDALYREVMHVRVTRAADPDRVD